MLIRGDSKVSVLQTDTRSGSREGGQMMVLGKKRMLKKWLHYGRSSNTHGVFKLSKFKIT